MCWKPVRSLGSLGILGAESLDGLAGVGQTELHVDAFTSGQPDPREGLSSDPRGMLWCRLVLEEGEPQAMLGKMAGSGANGRYYGLGTLGT